MNKLYKNNLAQCVNIINGVIPKRMSKFQDFQDQLILYESIFN